MGTKNADYSIENHKTVKVFDLIDKCYSRLGIPHFQRGLVWGNSSVSALLESLYFGIPCGSFVFWKSEDNEKNGVKLDRASDRIDYLIIDGQQRIRSLHRAMLDTDLNEEDEIDEEIGQRTQNDDKKKIRKRVWCVNLAKVPELANFLSVQGKEYSLFTFMADPTDPRNPPKSLTLGRNFIPWNKLREKPEYKVFKNLIQFSNESIDESMFEQAWKCFLNKLTKIYEQEFFVTLKETSDKAEIVRLYNRINSGGKRVEAEERAFARLVSLHEETWNRISEIFSRIHEHDKNGKQDTMKRDDVMERKKEKNFGFRLFVRIFIQACQFHLGYPAGTVSFDVVDKSSFGRFFNKDSQNKIDEIWKETEEVLACVKNVIENKDLLCCDSLAYLPDTSSLMPVFQMLIEYPKLRDDSYRPLLALMILDLMFANMSGDDLVKITRKISGVKDHVAFRTIPDVLLDLERRAVKGLEDGLRTADSMQNRYVLLLYWLERQKSAKDFANCNYKKPSEVSGDPELLSSNLSPERQHIIPFSRLTKALGEPDVKHNARHPFNNIGNLTYISKKLNGFNGVEDQFLNLKEEPKENLKSHFIISDDNVSNKILELYLELQDAMGNDNTAAEHAARAASKKYDEFCRHRRVLIEGGFKKWREDLTEKVCDSLRIMEIKELKALASGRERIERQMPRLINYRDLSPEQKIQGFDFDNDIEDALRNALFRMKERDKKAVNRLKRSNKKDPDLIKLELTQNIFVWLEVVADGIRLGLSDKIPLPLRDKIIQLFGNNVIDHYLYKKGKTGRANLEKLEQIEKNLMAMEQEIEEAIREPIIKNMKHVEEMAIQKGVLELYEKAFGEIKRVFPNYKSTNNGISFHTKKNEVIIGLRPEQSTTQELAVKVYLGRLQNHYDIEKEKAERVLGEPFYQDKKESIFKYRLDQKRLSAFVNLLQKVKVNRE